MAPGGSVTLASVRIQRSHAAANVVRAPRLRRRAGARARAAARRRARAGRCTWRPRRRHPRPLATPSRRRPGGRTQPRPVAQRKPAHEGRVPVTHGSAAMETRSEDGAPAAPESGPRPILAQERGPETPAPSSGERGKVKASPIHPVPLLRDARLLRPPPRAFHTTLPYRRSFNAAAIEYRTSQVLPACSRGSPRFTGRWCSPTHTGRWNIRQYASAFGVAPAPLRTTTPGTRVRRQ